MVQKPIFMHESSSLQYANKQEIPVCCFSIISFFSFTKFHFRTILCWSPILIRQFGIALCWLLRWYFKSINSDIPFFPSLSVLVLLLYADQDVLLFTWFWFWYRPFLNIWQLIQIFRTSYLQISTIYKLSKLLSSDTRRWPRYKKECVCSVNLRKWLPFIPVRLWVWSRWLILDRLYPSPAHLTTRDSLKHPASGSTRNETFFTRKDIQEYSKACKRVSGGLNGI